ncbi:MAG TPA: hypothetical protein VG733_01700 [Chthoniobacteraceae bacterium]|nr:hypothetical protein [Chthoniobacteraceae bacterium]
MDTHSPTYQFYFWVGRLGLVSACALVCCAAVALFMRPAPRRFLLAIEMIALILAADSVVGGWAYVSETWIGLHSTNAYEKILFQNRIAGPYAWSYWLMVVLNVLVRQLFWFRTFRRNAAWVLLIAVVSLLDSPLERGILWLTYHR